MIAFCERSAVREEEQRIADAGSPGHEVLARVAALRPEIEELDSALRSKALQR
jgi:hypothetical protein